MGRLFLVYRGAFPPITPLTDDHPAACSVSVVVLVSRVAALLEIFCIHAGEAARFYVKVFCMGYVRIFDETYLVLYTIPKDHEVYA